MTQGKHPVRVRSMRWECTDVLRLELEPLEGELPKAEPGAHVDLIMPDAPARQYSLTAGSSSACYVVGIRREAKSRGGSQAVHNRLRPGDVVNISDPRNAFPLVDTGEVHLIGGGIGITPVLFMAENLARSGRRWSLTYCARSRPDAAFRREVEALGGTLRFDDEDGIPDMAALTASVPADAHLYCCGPAPMLDAFVEACSARSADRVHVERFEAPMLSAGEGGFVVELARSGREIAIPSDKTVLDTLIDAGLSLKHSCKTGVCGECEVHVLGGEPDHRDLILTEQERADGLMLICCSRAKSERLVLDI